jgi:CMP-2-keto-3-deoxyoctulosonic acid synthetase
MKRVRFPWSELEKGQGFFVPCLDIQKVRMLGLRAALPYKFEVDAVAGVYKKHIGVYFVRKT